MVEDKLRPGGKVFGGISIENSSVLFLFTWISSWPVTHFHPPLYNYIDVRKNASWTKIVVVSMDIYRLTSFMLMTKFAFRYAFFEKTDKY
ncbi:hypothetical protein RSX31_21110 [Rossellomorea sp. YC4-1]|nr:hypothetical protein [Rossellomorea sp. YC4-1]